MRRGNIHKYKIGLIIPSAACAQLVWAVRVMGRPHTLETTQPRAHNSFPHPVPIWDSLILEFAFSISKRILPITLQLQYQKEKAGWDRNICYLITVKTTNIANWYLENGQGFCLHYHNKNYFKFAIYSKHSLFMFTCCRNIIINRVTEFVSFLGF